MSEDIEFKEPLKKLGLLLEAGTPDARDTKYACIVEAHESTRGRLERTLPRDHSFCHRNLVHKLITMPQAMRIPDAKAAVVKEVVCAVARRGLWERHQAYLFWACTRVTSGSSAFLFCFYAFGGVWNVIGITSVSTALDSCEH